MTWHESLVRLLERAHQVELFRVTLAWVVIAGPPLALWAFIRAIKK